MQTTKAVWRRAWLIAASLIALAVWRYEQPSEAAADVDARTSERNRTAPASSPMPSPSSAKHIEAIPSTAEAGSSERQIDLAGLRKALEGQPDAEAQVQRVIAFARFRDRVAAYGKGKGAMSATERARVARDILAELPEHVARNEIVPVQAQVMTAALLIDAEPDPLARNARSAALQIQWDAYAKRTVGPSPAKDPRYEAYVRQSRAIFQEVQATIADPAQQQLIIAQRLQALRVELFDHESSPDTH